jgi:iron(III) transport system ATP-binding protein
MSLNIDNLSFRYKPNHPLIENLSLSIATGEVTAIIGKSGCGKSTLINLILGLMKPQSGAIFMNGECLSNHRFTKLPEKRGVGVVFQDYALFPHLTVSENITFGLKIKGEEKQLRLIELLKMFDLTDVSYFYPYQLSGGQMQRVAIARAIAPRPSLLLLDEPFSNLDYDLKLRLRNELSLIIKQLKITTLIVTHDQEDAQLMAKQTFNLQGLMADV